MNDHLMTPTAEDFTRTTAAQLREQLERDAAKFAGLAAFVAKTLAGENPREIMRATNAVANLATMGASLQRDFGRLTQLYTLASDLEALEACRAKQGI